MPLEPYYHQPPPGYPLPPPEYNFRIVGYARYQDYVLTTWRVDSNDGLNPLLPGRPGYSDGQTLWRLKAHLYSHAGQLLLYRRKKQPEEGRNLPPPRHPINDKLSPALGRYGVPPAAAIALQDPANYVVIEP